MPESASILEVAGKIAGIGGLSLGVFLLLFREVIRKNIFPNLTKDQAYKIIKLVVILTFSIAVFGISAWVYVEVNNNHTKQEDALVKPPRIAQFALNLSKSPFYETQDPKFGAGQLIRTFSISPSFFGVLNNYRAIFSVSIENPNDSDLLITDAVYQVSEIGQVSGGAPGPLESNHTYFHKIKYQVGDQKHQMVPPYKIPPKSVGAFELELYTDDPRPGLAWLMKVTFLSNFGKVSTEEFQLILTGKEKS